MINFLLVAVPAFVAGFTLCSIWADLRAAYHAWTRRSHQLRELDRIRNS